jgi:glyoxylase I family protein
MRALLDDELVELGSSGRVLDRAAVEASLEGQSPFASRIDDFVVRALSPDAALTTYRLAAWPPGGGGARVTLRSSVWVRRAGRWVMAFHQGTPCGA